jgi:hypothetical protein
MSWTFAEHFGPLCFMVALMAGSQLLTRRAQTERSRQEALRLRRALVISFQALRALYESNLSRLADGKSPLASGRHQITLLRIHLGRLTSLDEAEVEAAVAASHAAEGIETAMSIAGKPIGGTAFSLPVEDSDKEAVRSALRKACSIFESAERLLASSGMPRNEEAPSHDDTAVAREFPVPRKARLE